LVIGEPFVLHQSEYSVGSFSVDDSDAVPIDRGRLRTGSECMRSHLSASIEEVNVEGRMGLLERRRSWFFPDILHSIKIVL
jgi:hypothetical protein